MGGQPVKVCGRALCLGEAHRRHGSSGHGAVHDRRFRNDVTCLIRRRRLTADLDAQRGIERNRAPQGHLYGGVAGQERCQPAGADPAVARLGRPVEASRDDQRRHAPNLAS